MGLFEERMAIYRQRVRECAVAGVEKAKEIAAAGGWPRLYLHCSPEKTLVLLTQEEADEKPSGECELLTGESLPPSHPYDQFYQWVYDRAMFAKLY